MDVPSKARQLLRENLAAGDPGLEDSDVYVVWFCYILGGWKALLSTTREDNRYYELTYDKVKKQTYIDTYVKVLNVAVKD